jgi:hypothetical protein
MERDMRRQLITEHAVRKAYEITGNGERVTWPEQLEEDVVVSVGDSVNITNRTSPGLSALAATSMLVGGLGLGAAATQFLAGDGQQAIQPPAQTQPSTDNRSLQTGLSVERGGAIIE